MDEDTAENAPTAAPTPGPPRGFGGSAHLEAGPAGRIPPGSPPPGPIPPSRSPSRSRRPRALWVGVAIVLVVAAAVVLLSRGDSTQPGSSPDGAAPTSQPTGDPRLPALLGPVVATGLERGEVLVGSSRVWVTDPGRGTVVSIDPGTQQVVATVQLAPPGPRPFLGLAEGDGALWVSDPTNRRVVRVDPDTTTISGAIEDTDVVELAFGDGSLWGARTEDDGLEPGTAEVVRFDPDALAPVATIPVGPRTRTIAFGAGALWAISSEDDEVIKIDPATNDRASATSVPTDPSGLAFGADRVWVADNDSGRIVAIDPRTGDITDEWHGGPDPIHLAFVDGDLLVHGANSVLSRIDLDQEVAYESAVVCLESDDLDAGASGAWLVCRPPARFSDAEKGNVALLDLDTEGREPPTRERAVTAADFGADWPFEVPSGTVACKGLAVTFTTDGTTYAINSHAIDAAAEEGWATIDGSGILRATPDGAADTASVTPLILANLDLC